MPLLLVTYDVPSDRRRLNLAKVLEDFGERVQLSVFECHLEEEHIERLKRRLDSVVDPEKDAVRLYRLCGHCAPMLEILGLGEPTEDPEVYIV